jgi:hypothetical protein
MPSDQPPGSLPVILAAPRMVVSAGATTKSASGDPCGARPMRRV